MPPAMIRLVLKLIPSEKTGTPRPPPPASAASVAIATVLTVAIRSPAMISGVARGISTRQRICRSVWPIPRAASLTELGTLERPTVVLR